MNSTERAMRSQALFKNRAAARRCLFAAGRGLYRRGSTYSIVDLKHYWYTVGSHTLTLYLCLINFFLGHHNVVSNIRSPS